MYTTIKKFGVSKVYIKKKKKLFYSAKNIKLIKNDTKDKIKI